MIRMMIIEEAARGAQQVVEIVAVIVGQFSSWSFGRESTNSIGLGIIICTRH